VNPKLEGGGCCRSGSEVESTCAADMPTMNAPLKYDDRSVRCRIRCSEKTLTAKRFALGEGMDIRPIAKTLDWDKQRQMWRELKKAITLSS
jgi:hypothetical protein